jgi:hypothetical protein
VRIRDAKQFKSNKADGGGPSYIADTLDAFSLDSTLTREQLLKARENNDPPANGPQRVKNISGFST